MRIAVIAGGLSPERDVSWSSGCKIANALMDAGHEIALADAYEGTRGGPAFVCGTERFSYAVPAAEPNLDAIRKKNGDRKELVGPGILELCRASDVVFIALHGAMGENGQFQAFLDMQGIRYTGSGYEGCLLAMDKDITKRLIAREFIPTADWIMYDFAGDDPSRVAREIGYPCVVKPCSCGSSIGVSIVENEAQLRKALLGAKKYENAILVEKKITGREFSVGILDGKALPPIEILPKTGFYDYSNKYQQGATEEICPAILSASDTVRLQDLALAVHETVRLGSYSRIDFIRDASGTFWCLEANTLPGMTPTSLLPQEALAAGIGYVKLCGMIAALALTRR